MAIIKFQTNIPVEVRLRSISGEPVESQFGGIQYKFTADEGMFYVSDTVGSILMDQFRKLNVRPGTPVEIVKAEVSKGGGRKGIQWQVSVTGFAPGEEPVTAAVAKAEPTELERTLTASIALAQARKQPAQASEAQPKWAHVLAAQSKHLVDVYAELVNYASEKHGNAVKPDDIRALMTTAFIGLSKGGNANAA